MISKRFGKLIVIKQVPSISYGNSVPKRYLCRCDCGNSKEIIGSVLRNGSTVSCGCYRREIRGTVMRKYFQKKTPLSIENRYYSQYQRDARRKSIKFEITFDDFLLLINTICHYCGQKKQKRIYNKTKTLYKYANGIDRLNSKLGYTKTNVVPCCKLCNIAKNIAPKQQFIEHIKKIYEWSIK